MRGWGWAAGLVVAGLVGMPSARTADAEAATLPAEANDESTHAQILQAIDTEPDPELKALMREELSRLESGELSPRDLELGAPPSTGEQPGAVGGTSGDYLPPAARQELEALFSQGTGNPSSQTDQALREEAEKIFEKYGIDPRELGPGHEGDSERGGMGGGHGREDVGLERAFEQMSPEAREQMERFMSEHEGMERPELFREMEHSLEAPNHEFETPVHDSEAPQHEYEAPQHEDAAPEYEVPQQEYQAPEQPDHEYQPPEQTYESQPPQP